MGNSSVQFTRLSTLFLSLFFHLQRITSILLSNSSAYREGYHSTTPNASNFPPKLFLFLASSHSREYIYSLIFFSTGCGTIFNLWDYYELTALKLL
jgi:hypothetical protein